MKQSLLKLTLLVWFVGVCMPQVVAQTDSDPPNIIFILADDLGYGDLGSYGQEKIQTPRLDKMAAEGMRFHNFYAGCTVCAPSRSVLMTGQHMGHTHVRGNAGGNMRIQSLRKQDQTVAEMLQQRGYKTALCGKWGLGEVTPDDPDVPGLPNKKGFDLFYGYQSQSHAHNYYPAYLWRNTEQIKLRNKVVRVGPERKNRLFDAGYASERIDYSHDLILDEALGFIRAHHQSPFFLYLPVTIPHANNEGTRGTKDGQEVPDYGIYENREGWSNPDKGQAAMITRLDTGVGQILDLLKELDIDQRTIVMFTSDNGHHNEGGHNPNLFNPNGPLRGMKRALYEGGIRVPMIVRWPGRIAPNTRTDHISYFGDFFATAAELTDSDLPDNLDSISFLPTLLGQDDRQRQHDYLYWEFYEQGSKQAVRRGRWKAIRKPMRTGVTELYDLDADIGEANNLAKSNPEIVRQMEQLMDQAHVSHPNWKIPKARKKRRQQRKTNSL